MAIRCKKNIAVFFLLALALLLVSETKMTYSAGDCDPCGDGICSGVKYYWNDGVGSTCTIGSCFSSTGVCSVNECGAACDDNPDCATYCGSGNVRYYSGVCSSTTCACSYSSEDCDNYDSSATDTDGGVDYTDSGTCTTGADYSCSGGSCSGSGGGVDYDDYCATSNRLREYYNSGVNCFYTDKDCDTIDYCASGSWRAYYCGSAECRYNVIDQDTNSYACTGCSRTYFSSVSGGVNSSCCGDDSTGDDFYYNSSSPTAATNLSCQRCTDGTNYGPSTLYGNGYMATSGTARTCYYGDITCSAASASNGASALVLGWGNYSGSLTTINTTVCYYGDGSCGDGSFSNGTSVPIYGNGYVSGSTCYYGDMTCGSGSATHGTTCTLDSTDICGDNTACYDCSTTGYVRNTTNSCYTSCTSDAQCNGSATCKSNNQCSLGPKYFEFFGGRSTSTSLTTVGSSNSNIVLALENNANSSVIRWYNQVSMNNTWDLDAAVEIGVNSVYVNDSKYSGLNTSANITFHNATRNPILLKNGAVCTNCPRIALAYPNATFNVTGFSNYTTIGNTSLRIWDNNEGNASLYHGNMTKYENMQVEFFANYTDSGDNQSITGATCTIDFSDAAITAMTYNSTIKLYVYNRSFSLGSEGSENYPYNVSCNQSLYLTLNLSDSIEILGGPRLAFTPPTPADWTSTTNTSVIINVSLNESNLNNFTWDWNGTNYSFYDSSLVLMYNFDNVSAIGENGTRITDLSLYGNNATIASAIGGTITTIVEGGLNYTVHTFTSNGTFNVTGLVNATVLVVAGGGGGGFLEGGGGGGGGVIYNSTYTMTTGSTNVVVGFGGPGGSSSNGTNGGNSIFGTLTATGGGGGGRSNQNGTAGGSGGGGGGTQGLFVNYTGGSGTSGQGYEGGIALSSATVSSTAGGGGGGASAIGGNSSLCHYCGNGGTGGAGYTSAISGTSRVYGSGGGGGTFGGTPGAGGTNAGAGGNGSATPSAGANAVANYGGGGGGGGQLSSDPWTGYPGGNGSTGVVIVRYQTPSNYNFTSGKYGKALSFNGTGNYVDVGNISQISGTNYTVAAWVKPNLASNNEEIISFRSTTAANPIKLQIDHVGSNARFVVRDDAGARGESNYVSAFTAGQWHYVVGVRNGNTVTVYVNGVNGSVNTSASFSTITPNRLLVGAYVEGVATPSYFFNGSIDEVRIWNRSLTLAEIAQQYHSNLNKYNTSSWMFTTNQSGLTRGVYSYYACAADTYDNLGCTETRNLLQGDYAAPAIAFRTPPTPANNANTYDTAAIINISLNESDLGSFSWDWNGTSTALYDDKLLLMYNFDNISAVGDSGTEVTDLSPYGNDGAAPTVIATGGTVTTIMNGSTNYTVHTFTSNGTFNVTQATDVEVLVVAGGGGAGYEGSSSANDAGGGGAGGLIYITNYRMSPGSNTVVIGSGGIGSSDHAATGTNGGNSSFGSLIAMGGGGGGSRDIRNGVSGGSGGGAGTYTATGIGGSGLQPSRPGDSGTYGYGNAGANSTTTEGTGGGGAGGIASGATGGAGMSVFGATYAVGGYANSGGTDGTANTGMGGDGGDDLVLTVGGDGGSGIVIVRYKTPFTYTTGKHGKAAKFDGVDDYINVSNANSIVLTNNLTIATWVYLYSNKSWSRIMSKNPYPNHDWMLLMSDVGKVYFTVNTTTGAAWSSNQTSTLDIGRWYHIAVTYNSTTLKIYVDGTENGSKAASGNIRDSGGALVIGADAATGSNFNGSIDEVRIYNRSFSAAEIKQLYSSNLNKHAADKWDFVANESGLTTGTYVYYACANDTSDNMNCTGTNNLLFGDLTYPAIAFTPPTPQNNTMTANTSIVMNVSLNETYLDSFTWGWNGTNYSFYDDSLVLMYNFDNVSAIGENNTKIVDLSAYNNDGLVASAIGGVKTTILDGGVNYTVHKFTSNGTFNVTESMNVEVLVVAGGGGGGPDAGGGGGAGGVISNSSVPVSAQSYNIIIGSGGYSGIQGGAAPTSGGNSSFGSLVVARGGGYGAYYNTNPGGNGGSGGGSGGSGTTIYGNGTTGQGYRGGTSTGFSDFGQGGGGGAGAVGSNGVTTVGGNGGIGVSSSINGSAIYYGGGGGGGSNVAETTQSSGGLGGGGKGEASGAAATAGTANTGGGGGGAAGGGVAASANGGSGIVIVRYVTRQYNYTNGKYGKAVSFNGVSDYIDVGNPPEISGTNYTVAAWIKTNIITTTTAGNPFASFRSTTSGTPVLFHMDQINASARFIVRDDASTIRIATYNSALTAGEWYHIVGVRNENTVTVYINGVSGTPNSTGSAFSTITPDKMLIGSFVNAIPTPTVFMNGTIDEVRIWNRSLTAAEIMQQYRSNLNKYNTANWTFTTNQTSLPKATYPYFACANDTTGNQNCTEVRLLQKQGESCAYSSGDWTVMCADNCILNTNTNLLLNNIIFNGTGTASITANITNWSKATAQQNCVVTLVNGSRLGS